MNQYNAEQTANLLNIATRTLIRWEEGGKFVPLVTSMGKKYYTDAMIKDLLNNTYSLDKDYSKKTVYDIDIDIDTEKMLYLGYGEDIIAEDISAGNFSYSNLSKTASIYQLKESSRFSSDKKLIIQRKQEDWGALFTLFSQCNEGVYVEVLSWKELNQ